MSDYFKHLLVRTPLETPLLALQDSLKLVGAIRTFELLDVNVENRRLRQVMRRLVKRRDANTIDVGAHIGSSLSLLTRLAPEGCHMAFEPMPQKAEWLRRKFPDVDVQAMALGERTGRVTFSINLTKTGYSGVHRHGSQTDEFTEIEVPLARLDDLVPEDRRIDFLKVVVEGAEYSVLRGAVRILQQWRPSMILESTSSALTAWGVDPAEVFGFLAEYGYELYLPKAYLRGEKPLSEADYLRAIRYPYQAFRFIALPGKFE